MPRRRSDNNTPRPVRSLFADVLPAQYRQHTASIAQYQAFFDNLDQDPVYQHVQVVDVDESRLAVAVTSPGIANYLRLHTREIDTMIEEAFGRKLQLKISVTPGKLEASVEQSRRGKAPRFTEQVARRVEQSASGVEDEALKAALVRLSRSIREE